MEPPNQVPQQNQAPPDPRPIPPARPQFKPHSDLLRSDEHMIITIRRHPLGIVLIYLESLIGILAFIAVAIIVAPTVLNSLAPNTRSLVVGAAILALAILIFVLLVATYVYRQSRLLITDQSVIQINQQGLFIRKVTRLSIANVEDVNAEQKGILASIFGYGTLIIQTAGTMENFIFQWCPNPNKYAAIIMQARQDYAESLQEKNHPPDQPPSTPAPDRG